jgi:hypothetical protein
MATDEEKEGGGGSEGTDRTGYKSVSETSPSTGKTYTKTEPETDEGISGAINDQIGPSPTPS